MVEKVTMVRARLLIIDANCILTFDDCRLKEEQVCKVWVL